MVASVVDRTGDSGGGRVSMEQLASQLMIELKRIGRRLLIKVVRGSR